MGNEGYGKIPLTLLERKDDSGTGKGKEGDVDTCVVSGGPLWGRVSQQPRDGL